MEIIFLILWLNQLLFINENIHLQMAESIWKDSFIESEKKN